MKEITVKLGRTKATLKKSNDLVGLKTRASRSATKPRAIEVSQEVSPHVGGFKVLALDKTLGDVNGQLDELREEDVVEVGTHVYHIEGTDKPIVPTGEIYIVFNEGVDAEEQQIVLDEFALDMVERIDDNRIIVKISSHSPNPLKTAHFLQESSLVLHAEPDIDTYIDVYDDFHLPTEDLFSRQWHLQNNGFIPVDNYPIKKGADAKIVDAWRRLGNKGSADITIAVVDNGFDLSHPDLDKNIYKPFDFWTQSSQLSDNGHGFTHGTPCAGVALARENGRGIIGAAPNAKFMALSGTSFDWRTTQEIFDYCINNGADIISCSWGSTDPRFTLNTIKEKAISKAANDGRDGKGCVILYAVGNDSLDYVNFYSAHPDVIAVAASTSKDEHAFYSNQGIEVTVCAPSNGDWPIIAPKAKWDPGRWFDNVSRGEPNKYKHFGGTSSSTPLVAGICALMLSANPKLTAKEVKEILIKTADKIGRPSEYDSRGHSRKYGYGRVNADKAVAEALRRKETSNTPPPVVTNTIQSGQGLFRFSVEKQESRGYGVQIGVFAQYGNVLIRAEKMQRMFNKPIIVNIDEFKGRTVYRMVVGEFNSKMEAADFQKIMRGKGIDGFVKNLATLK